MSCLGVPHVRRCPGFVVPSHPPSSSAGIFFVHTRYIVDRDAGNLLELFQRPVGQADFEWQSLYGNIVRFKTVFGVR
ncbi:hypothetical protein JVT61DRAFT_632 [Boletus reticuloceps]|uniref:Uncharacterized protein n=1 Tax=Boletus reticuloceps TaxID=495285 RepID=A0A8I2Z0X4_9AGAM|nr:hypothetical protein JVT61DRAFT_632 [Boletus reticuloceps]